MGVDYRAGVERLTADDLAGFLAGRPSPPSPERRLEILRRAHRVVVAREVDLSCDPGWSAFYGQLGVARLGAMARRDPASLED
jgi:hypothetical protein